MERTSNEIINKKERETVHSILTTNFALLISVRCLSVTLGGLASVGSTLHSCGHLRHSRICSTAADPSSKRKGEHAVI